MKRLLFCMLPFLYMRTKENRSRRMTSFPRGPGTRSSYRTTPDRIALLAWSDGRARPSALGAMVLLGGLVVPRGRARVAAASHGRVLFSAHMAQHEILMLISAPLLVLGRPLVPYLWGLPMTARKPRETLPSLVRYTRCGSGSHVR